jgi:osmotically-inducible protein OsmY
MKPDSEVQQDVLDALEWEPSIDVAHIGVSVEKGVVTLNGHVATLAEKMAAERVAGHVRGVRAIAQEIEVRPLHTHTTSDDEIAKRAVKILDWDVTLPKEVVKVTVQHGWVTLTGDVSSPHQRSAAEEDVARLHGVTGVTNALQIVPNLAFADLKERIEAALMRNAALEAKGIEVEVEDGRVILKGKLRSWYERQVLLDTLFKAPGVTAVEDQMRIV